MKRSWSHGASVFLAIAASLWVGTAQTATAKEEAKQHFDAGNALIENEDYAAATAEFELSVQLFPTKMGLFNLANCYKALKRYGDALDALSRLEREFAGKLGDLAPEVRSLQKTIEGMVGEVAVKVDRDGALVVVDGAEAGTSPLAKSLVLAPGEHVVEAKLSGYEGAAQKVVVTARTKSEVSISLVAAQAAPAAVVAPVAPGSTAAAPAETTAAPAEPAAPIVDDEQAVSAAVGKDTGRQHAYWLKYRTSRYPKFSDYMYDFYKGKKRSGIVLAAVLGPVFLVVGGGLSALMFGLYNNMTTCDQLTYIDTDGEDENCEPIDGLQTAGIVFAAVFGAATVGVVAGGAAKAAVNNGRMQKVDGVRQLALREPKLAFAGLRVFYDAQAHPSGAAFKWTF